MKKKKKIILCIAVCLFVFSQIIWFNPFTVIGAIRWSVLLNGFVKGAYTVKVEAVPRSEVTQIGDYTEDDLEANQTAYRIVSPVLRNSYSGTQMHYWIVTKKENGSYDAEYSNY